VIGLRDLHALTRSEGHDRVAKKAGINSRSLKDYRAGITPITVDHLFALAAAYPPDVERGFDVAATVARIGKVRARRRGGGG